MSKNQDPFEILNQVFGRGERHAAELDEAIPPRTVSSEATRDHAPSDEDDIRDDDPWVGAGDNTPFMEDWENPKIIALYLRRADDPFERDLIANIIKLHQKLGSNLSRAANSFTDYEYARGYFEVAQDLMRSLLENIRSLSSHRKHASQVVSVFRTSGIRIGMLAKIQAVRERDEAAEADLIDRLQSLHVAFNEVGDALEARATQCRNALEDKGYAFFVASRGAPTASLKLVVGWQKLSAEALKQAAMALDLRVKLARSRSQVVVVDDATKPFSTKTSDGESKEPQIH